MTRRRLVDQPTGRPTRKVTAGTVGAAVGAALARGAMELSTVSPWLSWLAAGEVQVVILGLGSAGGAFLAGYLIRDAIVVPDGDGDAGGEEAA